MGELLTTPASLRYPHRLPETHEQLVEASTRDGVSISQPATAVDAEAPAPANRDGGSTAPLECRLAGQSGLARASLSGRYHRSEPYPTPGGGT
jgi:hypothetical protein